MGEIHGRGMNNNRFLFMCRVGRIVRQSEIFRCYRRYNQLQDRCHFSKILLEQQKLDHKDLLKFLTQ